MLGVTWAACEYSWADFMADARLLAALIKADETPFSAIYAIPRGGLVLGTYLSHTLNLPIILGVDIAPEMLDKRVLIVDDNTITGESLRDFAAQGFATCVLFHNPESAVTPTYYAQPCVDFPVFPWEADACSGHADGVRIIAS